MGMRNWITAGSAAVAAAAALLATPAQADNASIYVNIAPPAPMYEAVPAPRRGHMWVAGHWQWRNARYVWVPGQFVAVRAGHHYVQPRWVMYNGRWGYHGGGWQRGDADRDGVPNRYDRDRDNDGRPNSRDRDRDGDGIRNRNDARPDNPYRN